MKKKSAEKKIIKCTGREKTKRNQHGKENGNERKEEQCKGMKETGKSIK